MFLGPFTMISVMVSSSSSASSGPRPMISETIWSNKRMRSARDSTMRSDVNVLRTIHHDFGDGFIFQQRFQRAQAQDFGDDLVEQALALGARQHDEIGCKCS